jgi:hypothetical protein
VQRSAAQFKLKHIATQRSAIQCSLLQALRVTLPEALPLVTHEVACEIALCDGQCVAHDA